MRFVSTTILQLCDTRVWNSCLLHDPQVSSQLTLCIVGGYW